ncbi:myotrophin [Salpingoeca rosetta]|uniref:Myotrophin n=1 Tax=Salpingoeca rosetta (strain ATCC 50818 / BSB-021) TaxID=946362 RepID=F2TVT3_SALR5|nr:myotrophin [Salpingoeca rosetta]EGD72179.1 myotrophin [Salpingoeca rosetta]|eukprot:XP_004998751.1 myotrophin [Salpingoeca rosetta]
MSGLQWSIKNGDLDAVKTAVEGENVDVNVELTGGRLPLTVAADMGQTDVAKYLIEKGADVNKKDGHGISALLAAVWEGHPDVVKVLLDAGADKSVKAPDGSSLISQAEDAAVKSLLQG